MHLITDSLRRRRTHHDRARFPRHTSATPTSDMAAEEEKKPADVKPSQAVITLKVKDQVGRAAFRARRHAVCVPHNASRA